MALLSRPSESNNPCATDGYARNLDGSLPKSNEKKIETVND